MNDSDLILFTCVENPAVDTEVCEQGRAMIKHSYTILGSSSFRITDISWHYKLQFFFHCYKHLCNDMSHITVCSKGGDPRGTLAIGQFISLSTSKTGAPVTCSGRHPRCRNGFSAAGRTGWWGSHPAAGTGHCSSPLQPVAHTHTVTHSLSPPLSHTHIL